MINKGDVLKRVEHGSDIAGFLLLLYNLAKEIEAKKIVELGVRYGESTHALLAAINENKGKLHSIDISPCIEIREKLKDESNWKFIKGSNLQIVNQWTEEIDFLFIDTSHEYKHTLEELNQWGKYVRKGGIIALHDTVLYPEVIEAIKTYRDSTEEKYEFKNHEQDYGMGILRKL